ncbi:hypothetical protein WJX84_009398 [Apatococcus fuscideae]|uniref:Guanylate cyclase domain-containing protein n=1 Tax=Apatococcus fuscideae TaxID=2026836 RepID=A0AAW1SVT9_9CHLO
MSGLYACDSGFSCLAVTASWAGVTCCLDSGVADTSHGNLTCDSPGAVVALMLPENNMSGELTSTVFAGLHHLQSVHLPGNILQGTLPDELASTPGLVYLNLANNKMTGSIPPALLVSSVFRSLQMDDNQLTGTLPPMGQAQVMGFFSLSHNNLSGPIPEDWLDTQSLFEFDVSFNQLTGTIPAGGITSDQWLYDAIGNIGTFVMRLRNNRLTGDLPQELSFLPLEICDVGNNNLTGGVSLLLSNTPFLFIFHVDGNSLDGPIPDVFASFSINEFHLQGNGFTGTLPASLVEQQSLVSLRLDDTKLSGSLPDGLGQRGQLSLFTALNSTLRGAPSQPLPSFLEYDMYHFYDTGVNHLNCPAVVANRIIAPALETVQVDPYYFAYMNCRCDMGYTLSLPASPSAPPFCAPAPAALSLAAMVGLILGGITFMAAVIILMLCLLLCFWRSLAAFSKKRAKIRGPPDHGKPLTLVATDIEGSTELWEWNPAVADAAIRLHDQLIRTNLLKYYGHELATEGDAFLAAFWEPADAIKFCIALQKALMVAPWSKSLFNHPPTAPCTLAGLSLQTIHDGAISAQSLKLKTFRDRESLVEEEVLFCGLRVRMSVATGKAELAKGKARISASSSPKVEYSGTICQVVKAISNVTHGGQTLMDTATMTQLERSREKILSEFLVHRPGVSTSDKCDSPGADSASPPFEDLAAATYLSGLSRESAPACDAEDTTQFQDVKTGSGDTGIMLIHMGLHMLEGLPGIVQLYQLAVPGLEERARVLPAMQTREQLGAGYLDAPGAALACLRGPQRHIKLAPVTMVFSAIDHADEIKAASPDIFQRMLTAYRACIRQLLALRNGYECQEADGDFMLVFENPVQAVNFCLQAQEALLQVHWEPDVLQLHHCCPVLSQDRLLFVGPRVRMGMYEGTPVRIQPHTSSGRADYFGVLVNRAARFCHAAAHGGQVTAPHALTQSVISTWTGSSLPLTQGDQTLTTPLHVQIPDNADPSLLPWREASLPTPSLTGSGDLQSLIHLRRASRLELRGHRGSNGVRLDREGSAVAAALRRMSAEHGSCSSQHALVAETKAVRQQEVHVRHIGDMRFKGLVGDIGCIVIAISVICWKAGDLPRNLGLGAGHYKQPSPDQGSLKISS